MRFLFTGRRIFLPTMFTAGNMRIAHTPRRLYDLTELVGDVFDRQSGKRLYHINANGCFIYHGTLDKDGYPQVSYKTKTCRASRFVYTMVNGPIPDGHVVRHSCDTQACINPAHLLTGTQLENIADKVLRSRQCRRANHHKAKLTESDVAAIREKYANGAIQADLASMYGVVQTQISNIVLHKTWR